MISTDNAAELARMCADGCGHQAASDVLDAQAQTGQPFDWTAARRVPYDADWLEQSVPEGRLDVLDAMMSVGREVLAIWWANGVDRAIEQTMLAELSHQGPDELAAEDVNDAHLRARRIAHGAEALAGFAHEYLAVDEVDTSREERRRLRAADGHVQLALDCFS